jgi:predicted patatin/cPLA2 family phospholipase
MLPSLIFLKYKMALNLDDVLNAISNENFAFDATGISSDEEEDLDRRLAMSDSDARQVFSCF